LSDNFVSIGEGWSIFSFFGKDDGLISDSLGLRSDIAAFKLEDNGNLRFVEDEGPLSWLGFLIVKSVACSLLFLMAPKQLKFSSIISFLICPVGNSSLAQPIEVALDGDDAICGIEDEVMASTPLEILDDPFDAVEEDEESSIFAVSGSMRPRPSF